MNKTRISRAFRGDQHVGWKKTVGGREWFLGYGTKPSDETRARSIAEVLEAKWKLGRLSGASELSDTDFEEAKELVAGRPKWSSAVTEPRGSPIAAQITIPSPPVVNLPRDDLSIAFPAAPTAAHQPRRWLFSAIDEFVATTRRSLKPDASNGDYVHNLIDNIKRSREALQDIPLDTGESAVRALRRRPNQTHVCHSGSGERWPASPAVAKRRKSPR